MSQENVAIVRRWVEFYNQRDTDGLIRLNTPDYEMKSVFAGVESGGIFRGHAGFPFAYFDSIDDAYERFELVARDFIDAGAAVVMVADIAWRGAESGAEGRSPLFAVFWLRAGKVFREELHRPRGGPRRRGADRQSGR
jgi:ketosteroid isomerase-like protein